MESNKKNEPKKEDAIEISKDKIEDENKPEGSGIFTVDGKELPKIDGVYTLYHGGGTIGENNLN